MAIAFEAAVVRRSADLFSITLLARRVFDGRVCTVATLECSQQTARDLIAAIKAVDRAE